MVRHQFPEIAPFSFHHRSSIPWASLRLPCQMLLGIRKGWCLRIWAYRCTVIAVLRWQCQGRHFTSGGRILRRPNSALEERFDQFRKFFNYDLQPRRPAPMLNTISIMKISDERRCDHSSIDRGWSSPESAGPPSLPVQPHPLGRNSIAAAET
jgi:hypothetical protein